MLGTAGFGAGMLLLAPVAQPWLAGVLLFAIGVCFTMLTSNATALVQLGAPARLRGRAVGLYLFAFIGLAPLGGLIAGWLVDVGGTPLAFTVSGTRRARGSRVGASRSFGGHLRRVPRRYTRRSMSTFGASSVEPIPAVRPVSHEPRRVVLRLHGDDEVELGRADEREPAMELARELVELDRGGHLRAATGPRSAIA